MNQIIDGYLNKCPYIMVFMKTQKTGICQISQLKILNPEEYKVTIKLMKLAFFITCQTYTATCPKRLCELIQNSMFTIL